MKRLKNEQQYAQLNLLALMPCPLKQPLEHIISKRIQEIQKETQEAIHYQIVSNAVMQENVFETLSKAESLDELPDIMIAPGIANFFYRSFIEKFRNTDCFQSVLEEADAQDMYQLGIGDPKGYYDMIGFNPLVFLVDTSKENLPIPESWSDLLNPVYNQKISYRGKDDRNFCEGVLLTIYKIGGEKAITQLGKTVKSRLHPAEMVKMAGSKKKEAPFISVIPLSFAHMAVNKPSVKIVWPKDGAAVNPIVMLVKKNSSIGVKKLAKFISGKEVGKVFETVGFYSAREGLPDFMKKGGFNWCGWDFIENNSIQSLLKDLNEIMFCMVGKKAPAEGESGCDICSL